MDCRTLWLEAAFQLIPKTRLNHTTVNHSFLLPKKRIRTRIQSSRAHCLNRRTVTTSKWKLRRRLWNERGDLSALLKDVGNHSQRNGTCKRTNGSTLGRSPSYAGSAAVNATCGWARSRVTNVENAASSLNRYDSSVNPARLIDQPVPRYRFFWRATACKLRATKISWCSSSSSNTSSQSTELRTSPVAVRYVWFWE